MTCAYNCESKQGSAALMYDMGGLKSMGIAIAFLAIAAAGIYVDKTGTQDCPVSRQTPANTGSSLSCIIK